jgi:hypothetical protein
MREEPEAVRVDISTTVLEAIGARARARLTRFEAAGRPESGASDGELLRRNILGLAGEQAVLQWLRTVMPEGVEVRDTAEAPDHQSDVEVTTQAGVLGIEVKTTTYDAWLSHGRSVPADQLYETDAEIYVWCAGPNARSPREVYIVGWSTTTDIRRDHHEQRYTGAHGGTPRPPAKLPTSYSPDPLPEYGLDDSGFDEHEWRQMTALRDVDTTDAIEDWDESEPGRPGGALATLLSAPQWREGTDPRPGFGPSNAIVRANATVRPLVTLDDWITQWRPDPENPGGREDL